MIKNITLVMLITFSTGAFAESGISRSEASKELTEMAKKNEVRIEFSVDPNDDTTLFLYRESSLKPNEISGDWTMYLFSIGTTKEYLVKQGFNKVRIYTSQSKGINDYVLKIL